MVFRRVSSLGLLLITISNKNGFCRFFYRRISSNSNGRESGANNHDWLRQCILYQDEHVLVINKPQGLAVQGGSKPTSVVTAAAAGSSSQQQYPWSLDQMLPTLQFDSLHVPKLVHRLDQQCSGVLLLARNKVAARKFSALFAAASSLPSSSSLSSPIASSSSSKRPVLEKEYWAICQGPMPSSLLAAICVPLAMYSSSAATTTATPATATTTTTTGTPTGTPLATFASFSAASASPSGRRVKTVPVVERVVPATGFPHSSSFFSLPSISWPISDAMKATLLQKAKAQLSAIAPALPPSSQLAVSVYKLVQSVPLSECNSFPSSPSSPSSSSFVHFLKLSPLTGRKHQLRVHCANVLGCPIVGDNKYNNSSMHQQQQKKKQLGHIKDQHSKNNKNSPLMTSSLCLHAHSLIFSHPLLPGHPVITVKAPAPDHFQRLFAACGFDI